MLFCFIHPSIWYFIGYKFKQTKKTEVNIEIILAGGGGCLHHSRELKQATTTTATRTSTNNRFNVKNNSCARAL